ncbi:phosphohydrolase [Niveispirillum sp.]|uniref:phosphohydrolase n=1 Tax=Niveispirillum sp. TaxID=1917217 RepID=UPI0025FB912E|nr:phosphohydrolase [Niveispirillum sp.]
MTKPLCIYHHNCADGFTAAWVVARALGAENVDFHPGIYGHLPPDVKGRDVIMVDFSYPMDTIRLMATSARTILILDHHQTAKDDLAAFPLPVFHSGWESHVMEASGQVASECAPGVRALFDMDRSGAQIAWDFFRPDQPRPALVDYVGDRDLWRFDLPESRAINAYIFAHPYDFDVWDGLADTVDSPRGTAITGGRAIEKKHHKDVAELVMALRYRMRIGGHEVWVANLPYTLTSDAGNLMAQDEPFAACYWDTRVGRVFSLRSTPAGLDVSAIAKTYGGGGHRHAAGFSRPHGWAGDKAADGEG